MNSDINNANTNHANHANNTSTLIDPNINDMRSYMNNHNIENDTSHECPVCNTSFPVANLFLHILYNHPTFLLVWSSVMNPQRYVESYVHNNTNIWNNNYLNTNNINSETNTETNSETNANNNNMDYYNSYYSQLNIYDHNIYLRNYVNNINNTNITSTIDDINDINDDTNDYEFLMSLCERIGFTKIGVKDIDISAPILDTTSYTVNTDISDINDINDINNTDICPICLDNLNELSPLRKIQNCGHIYCASCIETWFKNNRKCPICKQYACTNDIEIDTNNENNEEDNDDNSSIPDLIDVDDYEEDINIPIFDFGVLIRNNIHNNINMSNDTYIYSNMNDVD